jgi:hypothetical protein
MKLPLRLLNRSAPLWLLAAMLFASSSYAQRAVIVASQQRPFQLAAKAALARLGSDAIVIDARGVKDHAAALAGAEVLIAVGPLAARAAAREVGPGARVLAILTPRLMGLPPNRTLTLPLHPGPAEVLTVIKAAVPGAARVAVLADAGGPSISELKAGGKSVGLEVSRANNGETLSAAVDRLLPSADALWLDRSHPAHKDPEALQLLLHRAADRQLPVVGANKTALRAGALLAVVPDPTRHGQAAGQIAKKLLAGEAADTSGVALGTILINRSTMRTLGIAVPSTVLRSAELSD